MVIFHSIIFFFLRISNEILKNIIAQINDTTELSKNSTIVFGGEIKGAIIRTENQATDMFPKTSEARSRCFIDNSVINDIA